MAKVKKYPIYVHKDDELGKIRYFCNIEGQNWLVMADILKVLGYPSKHRINPNCIAKEVPRDCISHFIIDKDELEDVFVLSEAGVYSLLDSKKDTPNAEKLMEWLKLDFHKEVDENKADNVKVEDNSHIIRYGEKEIRCFEDDGKMWFVASDICDCLLLKNISQALVSIEEDEKKTVRNSDGNPRKGVPHEYNVISCNAVVALANRSRKAEAKEFRKWVIKELIKPCESANEEENMPDSKDIAIFSSEEFGNIRVIMEDGEPWLVAKDIANALGYNSNNMGHVFKYVPNEWKGRTQSATPSGVQDMLIISEAGFYLFVNRSDKPKALPFQMWVAGEVLPSIRKTGSYSTDKKVKPQGKKLSEKEMVLSLKNMDTYLDSINAPFHVKFKTLNAFCANLAKGREEPEKLDYKIMREIFGEYLIPTDIGNMLSPKMKPLEVNNLLEDLHFQKKNKNDDWVPIGKGAKYGTTLEIDKDHSDGKPITQLVWHYSIVDELQKVLNAIAQS